MNQDATTNTNHPIGSNSVEDWTQANLPYVASATLSHVLISYPSDDYIELKCQNKNNQMKIIKINMDNVNNENLFFSFLLNC